MNNEKKNKDIESWIDKYTSDLLKRALYLISNVEDAEDIVQNVFIIAFESYGKFKGRSSVKTWLMGILNNKLADFYRYKYRFSTSISLENFFTEKGDWKDDSVLLNWSYDQDSDKEEIKKYLNICLEKLPDKWSFPIKLYYIEQKETSSICKQTGLTKDNLWKILQRSRLHLKECIEFNITDNL